MLTIANRVRELQEESNKRLIGVAMMGAVFGLWLLWLSQPVF
jgi:hypothetical protein